MNNKYLSAVFALFLFAKSVNAQVGIGTTTPDASAILDVSSTNKGLLVPRIALTGTGDNTTVATPQISLLVYNTATAGSGGIAIVPGYYYWNGSAWEHLLTNNSLSVNTWGLSGNAGTDPATNFIGTTDSKPLVFKVKNGLAGKIYSEDHNTSWGYLALLNNTGKFNTAIGREALGLNASGSSNTASGYAALYNNTIGNYNTANGTSALYKNTTGSFNTANGADALYFNTTGTSNTATGGSALYYNTIGSNNTADGRNALYNNISGSNNTATGHESLYSNISGGSNTAHGFSSLFSNTTGKENTANGSKALYANSSGNYNTATGSSALYSNTTGNNNTANGYQSLSNNTVGSNNTASGYSALQSNISGDFNTAFGVLALSFNTTGGKNTAMGRSALTFSVTGSSNTAIGNDAINSNTTGSNNTAAGSSSLNKNATGSNNTAVGADANVASGDLNNATAIGAGAIADASNKVRIGNAAVTVIEGQVLPTTPSDGRFKFNIREDVHGLDFIMKLRPVSYQFDTKKLEEQMSGKLVNSNDATEASYVEANSMRHTGFIAQEVEKAATETGYHFTGIKIPSSYKDHYSLSYASFVMPLVKVVQEQQGQMDKLVKENEALKKTMFSQDTECKQLKETILKMKAVFVANYDSVVQQLKELQTEVTIKDTKEHPAVLK